MSQHLGGENRAHLPRSWKKREAVREVELLMHVRKVLRSSGDG